MKIIINNIPVAIEKISYNGSVLKLYGRKNLPNISELSEIFYDGIIPK